MTDRAELLFHGVTKIYMRISYYKQLQSFNFREYCLFVSIALLFYFIYFIFLQSYEVHIFGYAFSGILQNLIYEILNVRKQTDSFLSHESHTSIPFFLFVLGGYPSMLSMHRHQTEYL